MTDAEKELSGEMVARYIQKHGCRPCRDYYTIPLVNTYIKNLILNTIALYIETDNMDYAYTLKALLKIYYISDFDGKPRRSRSMESELILEEVLRDLYEDIPPAEIAEICMREMPKIRDDMEREARAKKKERDRERQKMKKQGC